MISVRRATLEDLDAMVAIYIAAWRRGFEHMFSAATFATESFDADRVAECRESIFSDDGDTFVALHGDRVVGFIVSRQDGVDAVIDDVWVHPSSWGHGAAGALVARAEDDMRSRGGRQLTAWVPEDSPTGRRFFDKLGWRPSGRMDALAIYPHEPNRLIEYQRALQSVDLTRGLPRPTQSLEIAQPRPTGLIG